MGLQNTLSDVSSESFIIFLVVLFAKCVRYLHSLFSTILHSIGIFSPDHQDSLHDIVGSRLAGAVLLCEQLNLNRISSFTNNTPVDRFGSGCVVCLNMLDEGDHVRELACRHAFHKDCFDSWLDQLNFTCPLCRLQLVDDEHVASTQRNVADDLLAWFPFQCGGA